MERLSNPRAPKLRAVALGSAVAFAVAVPLTVATANPAGPQPSSAGEAPEGPSAPQDEQASGPVGDAAGLLSALKLSGTGGGRTAEVCGPELAAPEGVEAQTCVLTGGGETWGRTYYRNASGRELDAVLALMGPGGRNVQVVCRLDAGDDPGVCETPRETVAPGGGEGETYGAVAEFASEDGRRSLLRAGSDPAGGLGL